MAKNRDFNRSNVNESTLSISPLGHSGFDLSNNVDITPMLGRFMPVNIEKVIPNDTVSGSFKPSLTLEKVGTPTLGRIRMDTHNYFVSARRINKDFRNFVAANAHNQSANAPTFDYKKFINELLAYLSDGVSSATKSWDEAYNAFVDFDYIPVQQAAALYERLAASSSNDYGFIRDWLRMEAQRLRALPGGFWSPDWYTSSYANFMGQIIEILRPYVGEDSIACYFGYPILTRFCPCVLDHLDRWADNGPTIVGAQTVADVLFGSTLTFNQSGQGSIACVYEDTTLIVDESFFRAQYAAWFDERRNFHYEKSDMVLNPDDFDKRSLIKAFSDELQKTFTRYANVVMLMIQRYCDYARDGLTTLQPDDSYRHVYTPVSTTVVGSYQSATADGAQSTVDGAIAEFINNENVMFAGNHPFFGGLSETAQNALVSDLQTMRRAGMLERWLARNFYHPDTYSGQIEAHYDCSPIDDGVLAAVYLGGNESQFAGEQQIANVGTSETPVGQRTFTGAASVSDSFSFHTTEFGYVISFLSLVPLVKYDAINSHIFETLNRDLPFPEYASDARVQYSAGDFIRSLSRTTAIGFGPRYLNYRQRVDRACGKYLTDYRAYDFLRDFYTMQTESVSGQFPQGEWTLNPYTMHIHANLDAFIGLNEWDTIAFGDAECMLSFNRVLPAAVEVI